MTDSNAGGSAGTDSNAGGSAGTDSTTPTVLITGGAGFVGSRLARRLALDDDADVRAMVHGTTGVKLTRLARLPVDVVQGDVLDPESLTAALDGADAVVHCAAGPAEVNVAGTRNLLDAAESEGVERVVHLSSYVVHGRNPDAREIDESAPLDPDDDEYSASKARAEGVVREYERQADLPTVTLRPANVYGPYGIWSVLPIRNLRQGAMLADGGRGTASLVYVENLVDAIVAALDDDAALGEAFLVADDENLTWRNYYRAYADRLDDHPPIREVESDRIPLLRRKRTLVDSTVPPARVAAHTGRAIFDTLTGDVLEYAYGELGRTPWAQALYDRVPDDAQDAILRRVRESEEGDGGGVATRGDAAGEDGGTENVRYVIPDDDVVAMHVSEAHLSNRKLKDVLGWGQRISFEEGMADVAAWMEYERLT